MPNGNETRQKTGALADIATDEDKLFRDGYVKGIASFIEQCATPMTIAIQGDWGTGKTSLMKLIEAELQAEAESSEDDTSETVEYRKDVIGVTTLDVWQEFSADPQANLSEILLGKMVSKLSGVDLGAARGISGFASALSEVMNEAVRAQSADKAGAEGEDESPFGFMLSWLFGENDDARKKPEDETTSVEDVEAFRETFIDALQQRAEEMDKSDDSRFVVFIDGLDHISPEATVDLMERVKNNLDCPRCVFVLSVDEKTVFDGVRKKFGDKVDARRAKLFFDRIVQVPFRIPSSAYNLDSYIKNLLEGNEKLAGEFAAVIDILLKEPSLRSIKRCLNTMYLYLSVFGGSEESQDNSLAMLLAAVVLQVESPKGFDVVAECAEDDEEHFAENLKAALESANVDDGVQWALLPALWQGEEGSKVDAAKRSSFLSWVQKLR